MEEKIYLFAYGTLRSNFHHPYAELLRNHSVCIGRGWFPGRLYDKGAYPTAVYDIHSKSKVFGEVYLLRTEVFLLTIDRYEGIGPGFTQPQEFRRIKLTAYMAEGPIECWAYVDNAGVEGLPLISTWTKPPR